MSTVELAVNPLAYPTIDSEIAASALPKTITPA